MTKQTKNEDIEQVDGEDASLEVPDELTIPLRKPVKFGDETYSELNLREPTMKEIEKFTQSLNKWDPLVAMNFFISVIAGVPKPAIDLIGGRDGKKAREYLSNFL